MARKNKTTEQFKREVYDLVGNEYEVLGEYKGSSKKVKMRHNKCGDEYEVRPNDFLHGNRCPECYLKNIRKTTEQFKKEIFDLVGDEYTVLGEYVTTNTKIKMKHSKCGHEYKVRPNDFLSGSRCPKCSVSALKTTEQFVKEVYDLVGEEYTVLGEYISNKTQIKVRHNVCGYEYEVKPNGFLSGSRCPKCSGLMKKLQTSLNKRFII